MVAQHHIQPFIGEVFLWNKWEWSLQGVQFNDFIQWYLCSMEVSVGAIFLYDQGAPYVFQVLCGWGSQTT